MDLISIKIEQASKLTKFLDFFTPNLDPYLYNPSTSNALEHLSLKICFYVNFFFANEFNSPRAQLNLSYMYERGIGVKKNLSKAYDYYHKSLAQNFEPACVHDRDRWIWNRYINTMEGLVHNYFHRKSKLKFLQN